LDAFKLYVKRLPDADNRREVENRIRALQQRLGEDPSSAAEGSEAVAMGEGKTSIFGDDAATDTTAPAPPPSDGQPTRKGVYVRLGLGLGLLHDSISDSSTADSLDTPTASGQVAVGYGLGESLVVGGGVIFEWGLSATASKGSAQGDVKSANLTLFSGFVDYYLAPRSDGWHLLGGVGFGAFSLSDMSGYVERSAAPAGGLFVGGGYEWKVDDAWAIGALLRLTLARAGQDTGTHSLGALAAEFNAAWY
jgi:hypothetical protein